MIHLPLLGIVQYLDINISQQQSISKSCTSKRHHSWFSV